MSSFVVAHGWRSRAAPASSSGSWVLQTATARMPARRAASMPKGASSNTMQSLGRRAERLRGLQEDVRLRLAGQALVAAHVRRRRGVRAAGAASTKCEVVLVAGGGRPRSSARAPARGRGEVARSRRPRGTSCAEDARGRSLPSRAIRRFASSSETSSPSSTRMHSMPVRPVVRCRISSTAMSMWWRSRKRSHDFACAGMESTMVPSMSKMRAVVAAHHTPCFRRRLDERHRGRRPAPSACCRSRRWCAGP